MRKTIFSMMSLCFLFGVAQAQTVAVADVEALPGETVEFSLNLLGGKADSYTALSFDVQFPAEGFTTTGAYTVSDSWAGTMATVGDVDATGLATVPFASSNAIAGSDVENLVSVSFKVDESVATGVYDVTLKNIMFEYGVSDKDYATDVTFQVKVVNEVTLDENSLEAPKTHTGVGVRVVRTIKAGEWSSICLPFAMTAEQCQAAFGDNVQLADFTGYDYDEAAQTISVKFSSVTAIEANHPYIIKVGADVKEFTVDGVDIDPEENPCVEYDNGLTGKKRKVLGTFVGTYVADFDFYNEASSYPLFISGGKFYYATENTLHMKAFRGYFDFNDYLAEAEAAASRISMVFDEESTGVGASLMDKREMTNDKLYNLSGQRVERPTVKGIYIKNHKKIIVK